MRVMLTARQSVVDSLAPPPEQKRATQPHEKFNLAKIGRVQPRSKAKPDIYLTGTQLYDFNEFGFPTSFFVECISPEVL